MAVYGIESLWVLGPLVWWILQQLGVPMGPPEWFMNINPFVLAWAPYDGRNQVGIEFYVVTLARPCPLRRADRFRRVPPPGRFRRVKPERPHETSLVDLPSFAWVNARRFSPSLDHDPVLWRECQRGAEHGWP